MLTLKGMFQAEYKIEYGKPIIYLFSRDEKGEKHIDVIRNFRPYFFIKEDDTLGTRNIIKYETGYECILTKEKLKKATITIPQLTYEMRDKVEKHWEADIMFTIRWLIDNVKEIKKTKYRVGFLDIETTMKKGFPDNENPIAEIISCTFYDNYKKKYYSYYWRKDWEKKEEKKRENWIIYYYNDEREMLEAIIEHIITYDYDILTAWNMNFDMGYIYARCKHLNINVERISPMKEMYAREYGDVICKGRVIYDLLGAYKKIRLSQLPSYSLNNVAEEELSDKKLDVKNTDKEWNENPDRLIEYNMVDVNLMVRIDEKIKIIDYFDEMRRFVCLDNINSCMFYSRVIDTLILRKYKHKNDKLIFPSKPPFRKRTKEEDIGGGYVIEPKKGLYEWCAIVDMSGLYPSLIRTFNLSKDVIDEKGEKNCINVNNVNWRKDKKGIIPSVIEDLLALRKKYQDEMHKYTPDQPEYDTAFQKQFSSKFLVNTVYGVNALTSFRLYDRRVADTITYTGRGVNKWNKKLIEKEGHEVVAGDTDSNMFKIKGVNNLQDALKEINRIIKILNDSYDDFVKQYGAEKHYLKIGVENVFKTLLIGAKKRYAGKSVWVDGEEVIKYKYTGFEVRRSDSPQISREIQKNILNMVLEKEDKDKIFDYIYRQSKLMMMNNDYVNIAIPTKLEKNVKEYVGNLPRCRAATAGNKILKKNFKGGSKYYMLHVRHSKTDVIGFEENEEFEQFLKTDKYAKINWEYMLQRNIFMKLTTIMEAVGWIQELRECHQNIIFEMNGQTRLTEYAKIPN